MFAQLGYDAATVRDIIRGTDLASGTFYNYFRSKEEVFEALADDGARALPPDPPAWRARTPRASRTICIGAFVAYFRFIVDDNPTEGRPDRRTAARTFGSTRRRRRRSTRKCAKAWKRRSRGGDAPRVDADYLACACIGIAQEVGSAMLRRAPPDVEAAAAFATGLILKGLAGAPRKA